MGSPATRCAWLRCLAQVSSFLYSVRGDGELTELLPNISQGTLRIKPKSASTLLFRTLWLQVRKSFKFV